MATGRIEAAVERCTLVLQAHATAHATRVSVEQLSERLKTTPLLVPHTAN
jgi:hypothetical protein